MCRKLIHLNTMVVLKGYALLAEKLVNKVI